MNDHSNLRLVKISPHESDAFLQMAEDYFRGLDSAFQPQKEWRERYFTQIHQNPNLTLNWILQGEEKTGFILTGIQPHLYRATKIGHIFDLYIAPTARKSGVGRHACEQVLKMLAAQGASKVQLDVIPSNTPAIPFWNALGFKTFSTRMQRAL